MKRFLSIKLKSGTSLKYPKIVVTIFVVMQFLVTASVYGQGQTVSGEVKAANGNDGLPGVNVYVKGTTLGTLTDVGGNFSINAADSSVLIFSFIGYVTQEIAVGSQQFISVSLSEDTKTLDEVVVVGYGEQKRSNVIGAVTSVDANAMKNKTQIRLDQALQGLAAGVNVTRTGGAPGEPATIHIRGAGSIGNTDPLWIVDGIKMEPGNFFDGDDVESMEILKDAAASAIYGAQAAHGVILVTTKRGKGDLQVTLKTSIGQRSAIKLPKMLNSADFVKYRTEGNKNADTAPIAAWADYKGVDTDWLGALYAGTGNIQSYDLTLSKGDEKSSFYLSFGHDNETGIIIDNTYKRYSLRINSDLKLTKWLKFGESILLSRVNQNPLNDDGLGYAGGIPYRTIPIAPLYDSENPFGGWGRAPAYFGGPNAVATQYQQHQKKTYNRLDGNVYAELRPLKGLLIRSTLGYNYLGMMDDKFNEAFDYGAGTPRNVNNSLTYGAEHSNTFLGNFVGTYDRNFGRHNVKLMGGYEVQQVDLKHFNVVGNNLAVNNGQSFNLVQGVITTTDPYNVYQRRLLSQFGRLNYNFDERYLLEANIRRDASAPKFGPTNIWGVFPSVSVGWRISQEKFFENVPFITNLKIRASSGKLGSDKIDDFIYLKTYTSQFSYYGFDPSGSNRESGYYITKLVNKDVQWEEVGMNNIAMDLKAFDNKFSLSVDYYQKKTEKLLYQVPSPPSLGVYTSFNPMKNPAINIGTMENKGLDVDLGYNMDYKKFNFNVTGNVSFMRNKMLSLLADQYIVGGGGGQIGGMSRTQPGMPISSFHGYIVQRMLNSKSDVDAVNSYAKDGYYQEGGTGPGDFMYKDISGPDGKPDGEITPADRTFIGNPWPKMSYAFNIGVVWNKMIDITLQFQGLKGVDVFNANKAYARNFSGDGNTTTDIYEAWTPERHTKNPRNIFGDPNHNFSNPSTYFVEDGSYLKLRNVQIGFNVPGSILSKISLKRARLYLNGNNVLTFTKYSGLDPEIAGSNTSRGVDFGLYPQVRTYSAGVEIQF